MEKGLIILMSMLIGLNLNTAIAQYDVKNAEKERLANAKVKSQVEFTHDYKDGKPVEQGYKSAVRKYDTKGNITEETNFNAAGKIISVITYQYDNKSNQVNYERYQGNRDKLQYSQKIVYDANSNKTKEYGYDGATSYSNTYTYNNAGKLSEINYTTNNNTVERRKLSYSGNKTDIQIFTGNTLSFNQMNTYNAKGNVLSEIKTDNAGKQVYALTYEYKNDVILMVETKKRGDIVEYQKFYQYDSANRPIKEETSNLDGAKFISHEYKYNSISCLEEEKWKKNQHSKEVSSKKIGYDETKGIQSEVESYFATYKLYSLYKYTYEFY
jgi:hypothetical protein